MLIVNRKVYNKVDVNRMYIRNSNMVLFSEFVEMHKMLIVCILVWEVDKSQLHDDME